MSELTILDPKSINLVEQKDSKNKIKNKTKNKQVHFNPKSVFIGFNLGLEKVVFDSTLSDVFNISKHLSWVREGVSYRIHKIINHPTLDDGYIYEIQNNGDGLSYIDELLEIFKDRNVRYVWLLLKNKTYAYFERKGNTIETYFTEVEPEDDDFVLSLGNRNSLIKSLYVERYILFYVSLVLFVLSMLSTPLAFMVKNVWYNTEKNIENYDFYSDKVKLPINILKKEESTEFYRLLSIKYKPNKGWHFIKEKISNGVVERYYQQVSIDGVVGKMELIPSKTIKKEDK